MTALRVAQVGVGAMRNFTYVLCDGGEAAVVDPSWDLDRVRAALDKLGGPAVKYVLNTHHHFDHTIGNEEMARSTGAEVVQHAESPLPHDVEVRGGDRVRLGGSELAVLHTPGHSRDSICFVCGGMALTGDTLFVGACGRVDLPGGSARELHRSLHVAMRGLDDSCAVYCGHDYGPEPVSTMGRERATNPAMRIAGEDRFAAMMSGGAG